MNYSDFFAGTSMEKLDKVLDYWRDFMDIFNHERLNKDGSVVRISHDDCYGKYLKNRAFPKTGKEWCEIASEFVSMFNHMVIWQNSSTMLNITPPANIASVSGAFFAEIFNPNFGTDESSGMLMTTELVVVRYLVDLVGWNKEYAGGIGTFGGKGTIFYAIKCGLKKAFANIEQDGINASDVVVFTNNKAHPAHKEACSWMGIGNKNVIVLPVTSNGTLDIMKFRNTLKETIKNGKRIGCILLNGGTTNEGYIDSIHEVVCARNDIVKEMKLSYTPHIHVDSVIGWIWLFFCDYDMNENVLGLSDREKDIISKNVVRIKQIEEADSFGADFHKLGFCPYQTSFFIVRNIKNLGPKGAYSVSEAEELRHGEYAPFEYSLELSRSAIGPVSAYIAMELFGKEGYQELILHLLRTREIIKDCIEECCEFSIIPTAQSGLAVLLIAVPNNYQINKYENLSDTEIDMISKYNKSFFSYVRSKNISGETEILITISRSYRLCSKERPLNVLKAYSTSITSTAEQIRKSIDELIKLKNNFDCSDYAVVDSIRYPQDLVNRD